MNQDNKWERRDNKQTAKRRMKVNGAGNKVTQRILMERAKKVEELQRQAPP